MWLRHACAAGDPLRVSGPAGPARPQPSDHVRRLDRKSMPPWPQRLITEGAMASASPRRQHTVRFRLRRSLARQPAKGKQLQVGCAERQHTHAPCGLEACGGELSRSTGIVSNWTRLVPTPEPHRMKLHSQGAADAVRSPRSLQRSHFAYCPSIPTPTLGGQQSASKQAQLLHPAEAVDRQTRHLSPAVPGRRRRPSRSDGSTAQDHQRQAGRSCGALCNARWPLLVHRSRK